MSFDITRLYSSKKLHRKEITACGDTFDVYIRRIPGPDIRQFQFEVSSGDVNRIRVAGHTALAIGVCNEDGTPFARAVDYEKMDLDAVSAITDAFVDINKLGASEHLGKE